MNDRNTNIIKGIAMVNYSGNYKKYMTKNPLKHKMVERLNRKILNYILKNCELLSNEKDIVDILDAGCGEGFISDMIERNVENVRITGLEIETTALDIAKRMNKNVNYLQGDICRMPFEDNRFDIVICTEVMEHLKEPDTALQELARVAKKTILLTVPNEPWFCMGNLLVGKNISRLGNPEDHVNHWSRKKFVKYVEKQYLPFGGGYQSDRSFPWSIIVYKKR